MPYRLYVDESGDHTSSHVSEIGKRYLGLVGVAILDNRYAAFSDSLNAFKRQHLAFDPDDPPILHREDILYCRGCYCVLRDATKKQRFDSDLLDLIKAVECRIVAVVLDKWTHDQAKYRALTHPYHYCFHVLLERYCGFLNFRQNDGDVLAEARGRKEDMALKAEYEHLWKNGTRFTNSTVFQKTLTSKHLKLKLKSANIAGLQLADILAHPLTRDVLAFNNLESAEEGFASKVAEVALPKYNKHEYRGTTKGWGRILLS